MNQQDSEAKQNEQKSQPHPPSDIEPSIPPDRIQHRDDQEKRALDKAILIQGGIMFLTLLMAGASIWQGFLTRRSNRTTRRSVKISERSLEETRKALIVSQAALEETRRGAVASSRAWVIADIKSGGFDTDRFPTVGVGLANVGHSPARITRHYIWPEVRDGPVITIKPIIPEGPTTGNTIPPGHSIWNRVHFAIVPDFEFEKIKKGTAHAYVIGEIDYSDQFGSGVTTLCAYWVTQTKEWALCPAGNDQK